MNAFASLKKAFASFSVVALLAVGFGLFASNVSAQANLGFSDDAEIPAWSVEAIEELMFQGVLSGNADGSFAPARALNRAEVSKIIILATGVECSATATPTFPDVQPGDWFYDYVQCMADYGWINGYPDGMFRPAVTINRAEIAKMVVNAFDIDQDLTGAPHFSDVSASDWFYGYVETAYNAGIMQGYTATTFSPASLVTRAETARIVYDAQLYIYNDWTPEFSDGALEVGLSLQTPAGTNIPFNATAVPYTTVDFTAAPDADVEIGRVTFTRLGLGDNDDFDNCWMEFDGFKVGNERSVTTQDTVELSFNPPIVVPAGQTLTGDLVCSSEWNNSQNSGMSNSSLDDRNIGHRNRFAIVGAEDILSTAVAVVGDFPIEGEEMETADYFVSALEFQELGSNSTIEVGDEFAEIGKFRFLNDSSTGKDVEIRAITFENDCDLDMESSLFNTALYAGGDQISFETIIDGDYITFRLDDGVTGGYILEDGDAQVFTIRTDVVFAENGDCAQFKLDNYEDVVAVEIGTSFGVRVVDRNGDNAEDENATLALYTIDSGDLNISRDSSNPGNEEYAPGSNEVVAQVVRAVVGQPMQVDGVQFHVTTGSTVADKDGDSILNELNDFNETFDNFRLYVDDRLIDNEDDITLVSGGSDGNVADYVVEFNTNFELAGTSIIRLVLDVEDDAVTGDQIKFEVSAVNGDFDSPEYIASGDSVPTTELLGTATGSFVEVEISQLIITKSDGFSPGDNIVAGEDNVNVLEFTITNNESGDVNITSITTGGFGTGAGATCQNYTLALFLEGVQVGSSRNMNSNCTATFNDISGIILPSGEEKEFTLVVNTIESSANGSTTATYVVSPLSGLGIARDINPTNGSNNNPYAACVYVATGATAPAVGESITFEDDNREVRYILEAYNVSAPVAPQTATAFGNSGNTHLCASATARAGFNIYAIEGGTTPTATTPTPWNQQHLMTTSTVSVGFNYATSTTAYTLYVNDATGFTVGSVVNVTGVTASTGDVCVTGVSTTTTPNSITVAPCTAGATLTGTPVVGSSVILAGSANTIAFGVIAVEADNVENGQEVNTFEAGEILTPNLTEAAGEDENCDQLFGSGAAVPNYLCGVPFNLIAGGFLSVTTDQNQYFSDILVADEVDVPVLELQLNAAYDDIEVTDIYLENDVYNVASPVTATPAGYYGDPLLETTGDIVGGEMANNNAVDFSKANERFDFKLYHEDGTLLDTAQMQSDGKLHFNLGNSTRIEVPKDNSINVVVKVNVRNINSAGETGTRLRLSLDTNHVNGFNGLEAVTASTGDDIFAADMPTGQWEQSGGVVTGQDFVAYRTEMMVSHAAQQVATINPSTASQEIYRFTITADGAHEVYVGRLGFDVVLSGFEKGAGAAAAVAATDFVIYEVNGTSPNTSTPIVDGAVAGDIVVYDYGNSLTTPTTSSNEFRVEANFKQASGGVLIPSGNSKTYALFMANTYNNSTETDDDYATVTIVRDDFYVAPTTLGAKTAFTYPSGEAVNVIWSDAAAPLHSSTTLDWLNGYRLDVDTNALPVGDIN